MQIDISDEYAISQDSAILKEQFQILKRIPEKLLGSKHNLCFTPHPSHDDSRAMTSWRFTNRLWTRQQIKSIL